MDNQQELLDLVGDIYEATISPQYWDRVLERVCQLTRASSAGIYIRNKKTKSARAFRQYGLPEIASAMYNSVFGRFDPGHELLADLSPGESCELFNIRKNLSQPAFYQFGLRPLGVHHVSAVVVINNEETLCGIGVHRDKNGQPFEKDELDLLSQLTPHFQRAIRIQQEFERLRVKSAVLEEGIAKLALGIIVVDEYGCPVYMNPMADKLLNHHPAIGISYDQKLKAHDNQQTRQLHDQIRSSVAGKPGFNQLGLRHPDVEHPLVLMVAPANRELWKEHEQHAIIYLNDPSEDKNFYTVEALKENFGLSRAEAKVALALLNGWSTEQIASQLNRSVNTVKTQTRRVYEKAGVSRQAELVRLLLGSSLPIS